MQTGELTLESAPEPGKLERSRFPTPNRPPPVKRTTVGTTPPDATRRRLDVNIGDDDDGDVGDDDKMAESHSPARRWYDGSIDVDMPNDPGASSSGQVPLNGQEDENSMDAVFDAFTWEEKGIIASALKGVDVTEFYSPQRVNKLAANMGLVPGHSLDLTNGWDFDKAEHRVKASRLIKST